MKEACARRWRGWGGRGRNERRKRDTIRHAFAAVRGPPVLPDSLRARPCPDVFGAVSATAGALAQGAARTSRRTWATGRVPHGRRLAHPRFACGGGNRKAGRNATGPTSWPVEADAAADLAERVAVAKTAREALKALEPAQPYTVDAATWDPGEAPEAVVSVTTSGDWAHPAMRRGEAAALGGAGGSGKSYLALAARGQNHPGIRTATHPRRPLRFARPRCKVHITLCNVCYTFCHSKAALCVAPRANSAAVRPSSRLAGPAPRRSRCSGGFIHGLLGVLPAQRDPLPVPRIVPPYEPFRSL